MNSVVTFVENHGVPITTTTPLGLMWKTCRRSEVEQKKMTEFVDQKGETGASQAAVDWMKTQVKLLLKNVQELLHALDY